MMKYKAVLLFAVYIAAVAGIGIWQLWEYRASFETIQPYHHSGITSAVESTTDKPTEPTAETVKESLPAAAEATELTEALTTEEPLSFPLDLNTATAEELMQIPGIGPVTAEAIIAYRTEHGGFRNREELLSVKGIGEVRFQGILDYIYLENEQSLPEEIPPETAPALPDEEEVQPTDTPEIPMINLNTATKEQLLLLPDCTAELADSILLMRDKLIHEFHNPLEIVMAEGMTNALYLQWEAYLAIDDEGGKQIPIHEEDIP